MGRFDTVSAGMHEWLTMYAAWSESLGYTSTPADNLGREEGAGSGNGNKRRNEELE